LQTAKLTRILLDSRPSLAVVGMLRVSGLPGMAGEWIARIPQIRLRAGFR
jgi:hypothetical protein